MNVSTKSRYALRLMVELAGRYGTVPVDLKEIARSQSLSEKYLSRLVIDLRTASLVDSFRGANGGYMLSRPPAQITVRQIVWAMEDTSPVDCVRNPGVCDRVNSCATHGVWKILDEAVYTTLENITLEDVLAMNSQKGDHVMYYL